MSPELKITGDGSHTLYSKEFREHYHSRHGALSESLYVFVQQGLEYHRSQFQSQEISLFEAGFGTGLNALLAWDYAELNQIHVHYEGVEKYPVPEAVYKQLNYASPEKIQHLHQSPWNRPVQVGGNFDYIKWHTSLLDFMPERMIDVVFFDAFAPNTQPEMWEKSVFEKLYNHMSAGAVLVTYCARGQFKRDLKACGFAVEALPGPPGKREMTRAQKM